MNIVKFVLLVLGFCLGLVLNAHAQSTVPADVQPMIDGASATWTAVKAVIAGVVLFFIGLFFAKKLKKT
jgi:uncharacterized protein HemY